MKHFLGVAAVGCMLQGVSAKSFKWSRDGSEKQWQPARETLAVMPALGGFTPLPTEAPVVPKGYNFKRGTTDNTCAYVKGDTDIPLYCDTDSACVYNSNYYKIGCCPDTSTTCPIWTTCYNSAQNASYTTDNGYTLWCGDSEYPNCITHIYKDDVFTGYTLLGCAVAAGSDTVYYKPLTTSASGGTSSSSEDDDESSSSESTSASASGFVIATTPETASTKTVDSASSSSSSSSGGSSGGSHKKSTPVGAIVGGVVGGVAALGLIGLAIFFLIRHNRKNKQNIAPAAAAANTGYNQPPSGAGSPPPQGYPQGPQMQQQYPPPGQQGGYPPAVAGFAPVDNRQSIQKPPYSVTNSVYDPNMPQQTYSPPSSPPPQTGTPTPGYSPSQGTGQPFSPTESQYSGAGYPQQGQYAAPQQPTYQTHNPQQAGFAHELPTARADGELRELA